MLRWETLGNGQLPEVAWERFMEKKNKELERLNGVYMKLLDGAGVEYFEGRGKIIDAHTLEVDGKRFTVCGVALTCCANSTPISPPPPSPPARSRQLLSFSLLPMFSARPDARKTWPRRLVASARSWLDDVVASEQVSKETES